GEGEAELEGQSARGKDHAGTEGEHLLAPGVGKLAHGKAHADGGTEVGWIALLLGHGEGRCDEGGEQEDERAHGGMLFRRPYRSRAEVRIFAPDGAFHRL